MKRPILAVSLPRSALQPTIRLPRTLSPCLSVEEVAQLDAITEKLILAMKDKGICGKKKGYKVRRKRHCR